MIQLPHGRLTLALHQLAGGEGPALLLLHSLGASSQEWGEGVRVWGGPVWALDFSGHGGSDWRRGGSYYPEIFVADADIALAQTGPAALVGSGIGAYVALLLAGARPALVPGALLLPGPGLTGGGERPDFNAPRVLPPEPFGDAGSADPRVAAADRDIRPRDYGESFGRSLRRALLLEDDQARPPWWEAVRGLPTTERVHGDLKQALDRLANRTAPSVL